MISKISKKHYRAKWGGDAAGILMIKCPATGRDIPIGIETDRPLFFS